MRYVAINFGELLFCILFCRWVVDVTGAAGTLYEGERFKLQFKFGARYPFDSPEVIVLVVFFTCQIYAVHITGEQYKECTMHSLFPLRSLGVSRKDKASSS